jgi:PadR family transcriptional regulator PadR
VSTTHDPQMLKGVLGLVLLALLDRGDGYGYGIVTRLRDVGFADLAEGTVYPALTRLEAAGQLDSYLLRSASGPARKYYRLTDAGRTELARLRRDWLSLVARVAVLHEQAAAGSPDAPAHAERWPIAWHSTHIDPAP